ncbi:hypothetical protein ACUB7H_003556 [Acinetobacter baumannii]|nr:hypothetical protein [Acinetobacter baumannii]
MTDLNKLRSEFEAVTEIYHCIYNADLDYYFSGSKFASDKAEIEVNAGWKSWKKAKAQAVPEGYVVVPKDVAERTIGHIGIAICHPNNTRDEENIMSEDQVVIERAIDASESGAEG